MAKAAIESHLANGTLTEEIEYQIKGAGGLLYVGEWRLEASYLLSHTDLRFRRWD